MTTVNTLVDRYLKDLAADLLDCPPTVAASSWCPESLIRWQ